VGVVSLALVVMWVEAAVEAPSAQAAADLREFAATGMRMDVPKEFGTAPSDDGQYVPQLTIRPLSFRPINLDESDTTAPGPPASAPAPAPETSPPPVAPPIVSPQRAESTPGPPMMEDIAVVADEPRYVAPTRRDKIGRIWAPVLVNGKGPFRLVLDTGATHSALTARVAQAIGIPLDMTHTVMLRGATGSAEVPFVPVETLEYGDLLVEPKRLPIVPDALGGAEGVLGTDGMANKRIHISFRKDSITIMRSKGERAEGGFVTIPVKMMHGRLLVVEAYLGGVPVKAVIDTGGQATLGNEALRVALAEHRKKYNTVTPDEVTGATLDVQTGNRVATPALALGDVLVRNPAMTFADFAIFEHWKLMDEPAMLIGMDVLGLLDTLIIDYRRKELQVKLRRS
jgi:aspartyl protease